MKIYTGNFANLKKYIQAGLTPISIALSARYYSGAAYRYLTPDWSFKNDTENIYTPKFKSKLKTLNKSKVLADLEAIGNGKNIILLCHERYGDFCHRHLVNEWLQGEGEFMTEKIKATRAKEQTKQLSIF